MRPRPPASFIDYESPFPPPSGKPKPKPKPGPRPGPVTTLVVGEEAGQIVLPSNGGEAVVGQSR